MSGRGGYRGGVKPTLPESEKRVTLSCRVSQETKGWLLDQRETTYQSLGELVDLAVLSLKNESCKDNETES